MAQPANIRTTLLKRLFSRPNPINIKHFKLARPQLFPGEDDFVYFLRCDSYPDMVEAAKSVIIRLVYHHHFPAPTRLLFNLLRLQECDPQRNQQHREGDYIPQDHFVHLAHLYLLGIYFFSYHHSLHSSTVAYLNTLRRKLARHPRSVSKSTGPSNYELFAFAWAHFVLHHDTAYPLERILPSCRESHVDSKDGLLKVFTRLEKSIQKDMALKALARLLVLRFVIPTTPQTTLQEMYLDHLGHVHADPHLVAKKSTDETVVDLLAKPKKSSPTYEPYSEIKGLGKFEYLPMLLGADSLRVFRSLFDSDRLCAVLENVVTGQPVLFLRCSESYGATANDSSSLVAWCDSWGSRLKKLLTCKRDLPKLAFDLGVSPDAQMEWRYFALKPRDILQHELGTLLDEHQDEFGQLVAQIDNDDSIRTRSIGRYGHSADVGYRVFRRLSMYLGYESDLETTARDFESSFADIDRGIKNVENKLPTIVANCVGRVLKTDIESGDLDPSNILANAKSVNSIASRLIKHLVSKQIDITKLVAEDVVPEILQGKKLRDAAYACVRHIRDLLPLNHDIDKAPIDPFKHADLANNFDLVALISSCSTLFKELDTRCANVGLPPFRDIVKNQKLKWASGSEFTNAFAIDHGFAAAITLTSMINICKKAIDRVVSVAGTGTTAPPDIRLARLAFGLASDDDDAWLKAEATMLLEEVSFAVAIHNLYPKDSRDSKVKGYRTDLVNQPFEFLALLADGLQRWDRERAASHAKGDVLGYIPGTRFDLDIDGETIYISLLGDRLDLRREELSLRNGLKSYLKDAHTMLRLSLSEDLRSLSRY
ncbi:hypothetical protein HED60_16550 [Planctomycetales bacterium ZRK34]|nr:hypothetical protein HED60_16550 [Planctomycetales bacterium ZRK34]